jgi:DNA-directed RNA polymerase specialized sigma24 family protein
MQDNISPEMSGKEVVRRIQGKDKLDKEAAFEFLSSSLMANVFKKHPKLWGLTQEDREDIWSEYSLKVWLGLKNFQYKDEEKFRRWLKRILTNTIHDHHRYQQRRQEVLSSISLNSKIEGEDSDKIERIEQVSYPDDRVAFRKKREFVLEIADQCLNNKQRKLLELLLTGQSLLSEWSRSWISTNKYRIKKKIRAEIRKRGGL